MRQSGAGRRRIPRGQGRTPLPGHSIAEYNHAGAVTAIELDEISVLAGNLRKSVEAWIVAEYPRLRP